MYTEYWKLNCRPFEERTGMEWHYPSAVHAHTSMQLRSALTDGAGAIGLSGGIGTGKSMLARRLVDELRGSGTLAVYFSVAEPSAVANLHRLSLVLQTSRSHPTLVPPPLNLKAAAAELAHSLVTLPRSQHVVLVIDGASYLGEDEMFRLLAGHQAASEQNQSRAAIVLVGTDMFAPRFLRAARASSPNAHLCILRSMKPADTSSYIFHRLDLAGNRLPLFDSEAMELIANLSGGVPRRINRLADLCLLMGAAAGQRRIEPESVWSAQKELRVLKECQTADIPGCGVRHTLDLVSIT